MTDIEILQGIELLEDGIPFDEIRNGDKWLDIHELFSEIRERISIGHTSPKEDENDCGDITGLIDWMHDDITWCRRKCPNKDCFRNQLNRRLKEGLISVADMYKEGECPKEAVIEV